MRVQAYLRGHADRGECDPLARFAPEAPELPIAASPRRLDVFQLYRRRIATSRELLPVECFTARIRNVTVATGDSGAAGTAARVANAPPFEELFAQSDAGIPLLDQPARPLAGRTAVALEISSGDNYYHWIMTALPKLLALLRHHPLLPFDQIVVNKGNTEFVRQSLEFLGVRREQIVSAADFPVLQVEEGYFAGVRSDLFYPHRFVVELFREAFGRRFPAGRRVYISRRTGRTVTNEDAVLDILRPLGFEPYVLEELSFAEQVRLFSQADAVVGPHGAGMSNMVFCPAGSRVLEIFSPQQVSATYWFLASACGHAYGILIGEGEDLPLETNNWRSVLHSEIRVDPAMLRRAVAEMGL